jgi:carbamoyltransferase
MNLLGINFIGHDAAATIFKDGKLLAAIEEERFTRDHKHYGWFPKRSIQFCLDQAGIGPNELDRVTYYIDPCRLAAPQGLRYALWPPWNLGGKIMLASRINYAIQCAGLHYKLRKYFPGLNRLLRLDFVSHHDAHLASCFFCSPFECADIISIDGIGEWETTVLAQGIGNKIERLFSIFFPNSFGYLYSAITRLLGFTVNNDEYKVMGLAGYGDPTRFRGLLKRVLNLDGNGGYSIDSSYLHPKISWGHVSARFMSEYGHPVRGRDQELGQFHIDMAASIQELAERLGVHLARHLQRRTRQTRLCLNGGVALNCLMNSRILEKTDYKDIFIQPAAYDASCALGGPLWVWHQELGNPRDFVMEHAYWGHELTEEEISKALPNFKGRIKYQRLDDPVPEAVSELMAQKIVGWAQGAMEWGPRALGNRSLLADPRSREMMDIMNIKVKHREDFRPFAPSVKHEYFQDYFDAPVPSPYMLFICEVKPAVRQVIPAVTHIDGTARYHTVKREVNPLYWRLLDAFQEKTGVPVILNTSFNVKGEPIVMTAKDAINCFLGTGIDVMFLGHYKVKKI